MSTLLVRRRWPAALAALLVLLATFATPAAASPNEWEYSSPDALTRKAEPAVLAALDASGATDALIVLDARTDTSAATRIGDWTARGQWVVHALRTVADRSQAPLRQALDAQGARYQTFWITNAIQVYGATPAVLEAVAEFATVTRIRAPRTYALSEPVLTAPAPVATGIAWGVTNIRADRVWQEYGVTGEGIVVSNIDTGVEFDHPALLASYRGNQGDGTVSHDYHWFDATGTCDGAPCDHHSHGTHTMGTMVGDDGGDNRIGVAPGATWIATNGCCPFEEALIRSGQWLLAPTDRDGNHPDPARRPHIVNNSWGSKLPTDDPIMEDVLRAWADAGMFAVFSNGNHGPACRTSGSPGSRINNYSVGAYGEDNRIADFSSRGPGQGQSVKPDIAAPGAAVRSALNNGRYGLMSGTSMAAPHVAGAVALLWSAQPELVGNIAATRMLLDTSAVDTPDPQCGGEPGNNNVYGEGRLDAYALVSLGVYGVGELVGQVVDADTGEPLAGATVTVTGRVSRETTTDQDGRYELTLVAGEYEVRVDALDYDPMTVEQVVDPGEVTTYNVALSPTPLVTIEGTVRDGSGHGWPLYARVTATTDTGRQWQTFTDPVTGWYALPVLADEEYRLRVEAQLPGYSPWEQSLSVGRIGLTQEVDLRVSPVCVAPGYAPDGMVGYTESFDPPGADALPGLVPARPGAPVGWEVTDTDPGYPGYQHRPGWVFDDPGQRGNRTGGEGGFAIVDSDHAGQHHVQVTALTSPVFDLTEYTTPVLVFASDLVPAVNSTARVEISVDSGQTWREVWRDTGFPGQPGPAPQLVALPEAAGEPEVRVRFSYSGQWSGWWAIDDVFLGDRGECLPVPGGLLTGQVIDAVSGEGLTGAIVVTAAAPDTPATTVATPDDPALDDGWYWLFSPEVEEQEVSAAAPGYRESIQTVSVAANEVVRVDFSLVAQ